MKPMIYIALTNDWELRGDGSGDIEKIQFEPVKEVIHICNKYGIRAN